MTLYNYSETDENSQLGFMHMNCVLVFSDLMITLT